MDAQPENTASNVWVPLGLVGFLLAVVLVLVLYRVSDRSLEQAPDPEAHQGAAEPPPR